MKWGRETSEKCDQDNVIQNPSSVQARRMITGQKTEGLERKTRRKKQAIHSNFKRSRATQHKQSQEE